MKPDTTDHGDMWENFKPSYYNSLYNIQPVSTENTTAFHLFEFYFYFLYKQASPDNVFMCPKHGLSLPGSSVSELIQDLNDFYSKEYVLQVLDNKYASKQRNTSSNYSHKKYKLSKVPVFLREMNTKQSTYKNMELYKVLRAQSGLTPLHENKTQPVIPTVKPLLSSTCVSNPQPNTVTLCATAVGNENCK